MFNADDGDQGHTVSLGAYLVVMVLAGASLKLGFMITEGSVNKIKTMFKKKENKE